VREKKRREEKIFPNPSFIKKEGNRKTLQWNRKKLGYHGRGVSWIKGCFPPLKKGDQGGFILGWICKSSL
jgi:hypothetical protein